MCLIARILIVMFRIRIHRVAFVWLSINKLRSFSDAALFTLSIWIDIDESLLLLTHIFNTRRGKRTCTYSDIAETLF